MKIQTGFVAETQQAQSIALGELESPVWLEINAI
jgi:hypothetical protein